MLSREDNELICRVGPGTPMGTLMRQYWVPALLSSELPSPDSDPMRLLLLGEKLIAFRDTNGKVGIVQNHCPHRGASLFFGRNEEAGLRCVYHGWKFDVTGQCVDMPNEPAESNFKAKVRAVAYPTQERGGVVWAYMGSRATPPPLPDLEGNMLPEGEYNVTVTQRECNWLQALEGDVDTSHLAFLHRGSVRPDEVLEGSFMYWTLTHPAPYYQVLDTDYGAMYGAYRAATEGQEYWRVAHFLFPFFTMAPGGLLGTSKGVIARVPMDDTHTLNYQMGPRMRMRVDSGPGSTATRGGDNTPIAFRTPLLPTTTDWCGRFRTEQSAANDYQVDRQLQRANRGVDGYAGIRGGNMQDQAVTESMGPIYDRTQERLGTSDTMIIRVRRRLIAAAKALRDSGITPPGVDTPEVYRQRS
ncbi:MAG TPA: Rieske 2Fe-2S domain-containing protein, partial [Chloroflexota bacterium]|nr:Rieske 2Fe-2S domain-containing protein [Chloroflexota bacterium]